MRVLLTGDSMLTRPPVLTAEAGAERLRDLIATADVRFTNLEVVPNDFEGDPIPSDGGMHLAAPASVIDALLGLGFNLLSGANNHALDYGVAGVRAGLRNLEARGATIAGIGRNLTEARRSAYVHTPAGSAAVVACTTAYRPGQQAGAQREDAPGRPGVSHIGSHTVYEVPRETLAQLDVLATELGFADARRHLAELGVPGMDGDADEVHAFGCRFRSGPRAREITTYDPTDVADVLGWVAEARRRAGMVVFSVHSHEPEQADGSPPDALRELCRGAAAAGATVVAVHGAHAIRGVEIHRGVPIFYGLGNFIAQNDLVERLPQESYDFFGVIGDARPSDVPNARSHNETRGFPTMSECWESVLPICTFEGNDLLSIEVRPLTLGYGAPIFDRGRPQIPHDGAGKEILARFVAQSRTFGTVAQQEDDRVVISPPG